MFKNAIQFNKKNSPVYKDALAIRTRMYDFLGEKATDMKPPTIIKLKVEPSKKQQTPKSEKNANITEWKAIMKKVAALRDGSGRILSALFQELPDAQDYGDYYQEVNIHTFQII